MGSLDSLRRAAFSLVRALRLRLITPTPVAVIYVYQMRVGKFCRWCWEIRTNEGIKGDGVKLSLDDAMWCIAEQLDRAGISPDAAPIAWHPPIDEVSR